MPAVWSAVWPKNTIEVDTIWCIVGEEFIFIEGEGVSPLSPRSAARGPYILLYTLPIGTHVSLAPGQKRAPGVAQCLDSCVVHGCCIHLHPYGKESPSLYLLAMVVGKAASSHFYM